MDGDELQPDDEHEDAEVQLRGARPRPPLPALGLLTSLAGVACAERPPDVVFLTVDTLRFDHVGTDRDGRPLTPYVDKLLADSVLYTEAYTPITVTGPAFSTLLTGLDVGQHEVALNLFRGGNTLGPEVETLAERLQARGYATGAFVSGFTLRALLGLNQGFDLYFEPEGQRHAGAWTADAAVDWLGGIEGPVFLWFHTFDVHGPLAAEAPVRAGRAWKRGGAEPIAAYQRIGDITDPAFYEARYAEAVRAADAEVGRVLDALRRLDRYDDALIVFAADHGESFDERELWFDHGTSALDEQAHIPLAVKLPQGRHAGERSPALVTLRDVAPTVAEVLGLPPSEAWSGRSLATPTDAGHRSVITESSHCKRGPALDCAPKGPLGKMFAIRLPGRTVVRHSTARGPEYAVYDRMADHLERSPIEEAVSDEARAALEAAAASRAAMRLADPDAGPAELPGEASGDAEALEGLGYVELGVAAPD